MEKALFGTEFKEYITPTYKKQLEKNKRWEEKQKRRQEKCDKDSVVAKKDMSAFYRNLMERNVAYGGKNDEEDSSSLSDDEDKEAEKRLFLENSLQRAELKRKRIEETRAQAEILRRERDETDNTKLETLKSQYRIHVTTKEEEKSARERFLERKRARVESSLQVPSKMNSF
eukprot:TRINITY_DN11659_c0_g1_i3.p1 TRINITY_DN11659_c0_g1~~TRINITY_DN11659_c0_g1_i3.p1  ORF type:complete len:172 (-),score=61.56 TRINITY_DN11659_c0_g1_i3:146-661(-)